MSKMGNFVVNKMESDAEFARTMEFFDRARGSEIGITDPKKLARRDGPETSKQAARSINATRLELLVFDVIKASGRNGVISDDVRKALTHHNLSYSSVTARYKSLKEKGWIRLTGERRSGQSGRNQNVMVAVK